MPTRVQTVSRKASTRRSVLRALIFDDDDDVDEAIFRANT